MLGAGVAQMIAGTSNFSYMMASNGDDLRDRMFIRNVVDSQKNNQETLLLTSQSPDKKYNLEAYRTEAGATVDFSIKVYMVFEDKRELIYNSYHEYDVSISWIDNDHVLINNKILDLSCGEKYDWRNK